MKKILIIGALMLSMGLFFGDAPHTFAQLHYTPLEPINGVTTGAETLNFPALLNRIFTIIFSVAALIAVVNLVIGGIQYMVSPVVEVKFNAKERIWAALYGVLILAGSYLILHTINPNLVKLTFPALPSTASSATYFTPTSGSSGASGSTVAPGAAALQNNVLSPITANPMTPEGKSALLKFTLDCGKVGGGAYAQPIGTSGSGTIYGCQK
jgi:uncharacterized membrane protein